MVILGCYLLLFRGDRLGKARLVLGARRSPRWRLAPIRRIWVFMGGLLIAAVAVKLARRWQPRLPRPDLQRGVIGLRVGAGADRGGQLRAHAAIFSSASRARSFCSRG